MGFSPTLAIKMKLWLLEINDRKYRDFLDFPAGWFIATSKKNDAEVVAEMVCAKHLADSDVVQTTHDPVSQGNEQ